jgi:hypothetical protein
MYFPVNGEAAVLISLSWKSLLLLFTVPVNTFPSGSEPVRGN